MFVHSFILGTAVIIITRFRSVQAQDTRVFDEFMTEPSFRSPYMNITHRSDEEHRFAPGYYFYEPFALDGAPGAPIIFDSHGELVWYGRDATIHGAKNFRVCDYLGEKANHLCWSEFSWTSLGNERSRNRIFDNTYAPARRDFGAVGDLDDPNPHEFNMLADGQTYIHAVYQMRHMNLEPYGPKNGYIIDPCFQEVDVVTGRPVFRWCGLEHFELWETIMFPHIAGQTNYSEPIGGDATPTGPWDFAHINGIDKILTGPSAGDYLVSARHHDSIYKVAGRDTLSGEKPGTVLWRLGGECAVRNDFEMASNWTFSRQHHISFLGYGGEDGTQLKVSLFCNGWEIRNKAGFAGRASSGQVILLDESTMLATLAHEYVSPSGGLAIAQGGMHVRPAPYNNAVIGWGTVPEISEFAEDGTLLFHARFNDAKARNYRAYKFPWVGRPTTSPKLLAYSQSCSNTVSPTDATTTTTHSRQSPLIAYVSWNGATEVFSYRFHISTHSASGPWLPAGTFPRTGFETKANLSSSSLLSLSSSLSHVGADIGFVPYVSVQALDAHGNVLGQTTAATWVPRKDASVLEGKCGESGCEGEGLEWFTYPEELSCAGACKGSVKPAIGALLILAIGVECLCWLGMKAFYKVVRRLAQKDGGLPRFVSDNSGYKKEGRSASRWLGATLGGGRPGVKRSRSGLEEAGKADALLKASGSHDARG